ncbi:MAG: response regulator [Gammaproteobacteria bacterium]|nr:response regulator [Gammaproteobacteria bacterium]
MYRHRILVVDDEPIILSLLTEVLSGDYDLVTASGGMEGLKKSVVEPVPDLILLDWLMPGVDGVTVCEQLKRNPVTAEVPVLFLTIKSSISDEVRGLKAGAVDYIHKPISPPQLLARVRAHLELNDARKALVASKNDLLALLEERSKELAQARELALACLKTLVFRDVGSDNAGQNQYLRELQQLSGSGDPDWQSLLNVEDSVEREQSLLEADILAQLAKITASTQFVNAERMRSLLEFIVTETVAGHAGSLKAFTIAVEVFQRDEHFDPQQDPLIRVQVGNLRKRLDKYYKQEGRSDKVDISIPKGSYCAVFKRRLQLSRA